MKKIIILLLFAGLTTAQTKTNLDIFYNLLDSALSEAASAGGNPDSTKRTFYFEAGELNKVFYNRAMSEMQRRNFTSAAVQESDLVFVVEQSSVTYGEMYREGFLGSFYMPRDLRMNGNYLIKHKDKYEKFNMVYEDTVAVDSIEFIENEIFPFTRGSVPAEPFFSSLLEPAIAIGTTALAVILFFSIRSK